MVVKLDLKPEVQAGLLAEAETRGLSLEEYLEQLIRDYVIGYPLVPAEEWEKEF